MMFIFNSCGQNIIGHAFLLLYTCYYFYIISQCTNVTKCFITVIITKEELENCYFILSETIMFFLDSRVFVVFLGFF